MNNLLVILLFLFLALIIVIPLLERFGSKASSQPAPKMARWILPLVMILLIMQLLRFWFG